MRRRKNSRKEADGEEVNIHTKRCQTVSLCHTNATKVPEFAQMQMVPKQWSRYSKFKLSCGTDAGSSGRVICSFLMMFWSIYIRASVCLRSERGYVVLRPLHILFISIPADINTEHIQDVTMETKHTLHGPRAKCTFASVYYG